MLTVGTTPLLRAAKAQDAAAIKLLLEHGAIVDLPNNQGMTPMLAASGMGSVDADTRGNYYAADIQERAIASLDSAARARRGIEWKGRPLAASASARRGVLGLE